VGPEPAGAALEEQGLGWINTYGKGNAEDTFTSGLEGAWTAAPTGWTMMFLQNLLSFEWEQTDLEAFAVLEPKADGFRNYYSNEACLPPTESLVDKADLLRLTEMTVLVGGMRALDANTGGSKHGVFTKRPGTLVNDFFVNLLDMSTKWSKSDEEGVYQGRDRATGELKWTATSVDLIFGSNAELRAVAEVYAQADGDEQLVQDFVDAWTKVMTLDRFDL
jgi:catalase-peroxidase